MKMSALVFASLLSSSAMAADCLTVVSAEEKTASALKEIRAEYSVDGSEVKNLESFYILSDELTLVLRFDLKTGTQVKHLAGVQRYDSRTCELLESVVGSAARAL